MSNAAASTILAKAHVDVAAVPEIAAVIWGKARTAIERLMRKATERDAELEAAWNLCSEKRAAALDLAAQRKGGYGVMP